MIAELILHVMQLIMINLPDKVRERVWVFVNVQLLKREWRPKVPNRRSSWDLTDRGHRSYTERAIQNLVNSPEYNLKCNILGAVHPVPVQWDWDAHYSRDWDGSDGVVTSSGHGLTGDGMGGIGVGGTAHDVGIVGGASSASSSSRVGGGSSPRRGSSPTASRRGGARSPRSPSPPTSTSRRRMIPVYQPERKLRLPRGWLTGSETDAERLQKEKIYSKYSTVGLMDQISNSLYPQEGLIRRA